MASNLLHGLTPPSFPPRKRFSYASSLNLLLYIHDHEHYGRRYWSLPPKPIPKHPYVLQHCFSYHVDGVSPYPAERGGSDTKTQKLHSTLTRYVAACLPAANWHSPVAASIASCRHDQVKRLQSAHHQWTPVAPHTCEMLERNAILQNCHGQEQTRGQLALAPHR